MNNSASHRPSGIAIITGASSGIGASTARLMSQLGWAILLVGRNHKRLEQTASALSAPHAIVVCDVTDRQAPDKIRRALTSDPLKDLPLKALVNNAGIVHRKPFGELSDELWQEELEVHVLAPARLTRGLLQNFAPQGAIVNVSSTLGFKPIPQTAAYSAAKAALNSLTRSLALELAPNVRVNAVCPGIVDTPIHSFHHETGANEARQQAHRMQPLGRMGTADDVARAIAFLAGPESAWTTGSLFTVDGGISLL